MKTGEETIDHFAFLTCEPNAEVGAVHQKAMPVILTTADQLEFWMTAPAHDALKMQKPVDPGRLTSCHRSVVESLVIICRPDPDHRCI